MNTIQNLLKTAILYLEQKGIKNAKISAEVFLSYILKIKKNELPLFWQKSISDEEKKIFDEYIQRRANKEPIDYIIGEIEFYGCNFSLTRDVLIPRQETEILVDLVSSDLEKDNLEDKILFDICTGSGSIGISLKKKFENLKVYLSDISKKALDIARTNAKKNSVRVILKEGDLLLPFDDIKADFVICNPPYVSSEEYEHLDEDVKNFEPKKALIAKDRGLEFYSRIEKEIYNYLRPKAKLYFEIGNSQKEDIIKIFSSNKWKTKKVYKDFSAQDRFFFVEIE